MAKRFRVEIEMRARKVVEVDALDRDEAAREARTHIDGFLCDGPYDEGFVDAVYEQEADHG